MKVIEYNDRIYYLKLSIKNYIAIHQLGLIERLANMPTTLDYVSLCSIIMDEYNFNSDELYDFMDFITEEYDMYVLLEELLLDSGIISENKGDTEALEVSEENYTSEREETLVDAPIEFMEQIKPLMSDCLAYGMDVDTFYNMTLKEIEIYSDGMKEKVKRENHDRAMFDYALANLITIGTSRILGGKGQFPTFDKYYGEMLGEKEEVNMDDLVLEGYADGVPVYHKKTEDDVARKQFLAIVEQNRLASLQKKLENDRNGVE